MAELGFKSFVQRKVQLITESARDRRLTRAKKLLSGTKSSRAVSTVRISSDKKIFTVDQFHNCRNDCWLAMNKDNVEFICTMKHLQHVMVLGILASDRQRMPPIFFCQNEKCNTNVYYKILQYKVLLWLRSTYLEGNYVFQQDRAQAHMATKVQNFLHASFTKFWPPLSPDLNSLDYFWWSIMERKVNAMPHPNLDYLTSMITEIWEAYPADGIVDACHSFCCCVKAVVKAKGLYIEH